MAYDINFMLDQARHYRRAGYTYAKVIDNQVEQLRSQGTPFGSILYGKITSVVIEAFALELYFKALLTKQGANESVLRQGGHKYDVLFSNLTSESKDRLEEGYQKFIEENPDFQDIKTLKAAGKDVPATLLECLILNRNAFQLFRYAFERQNVVNGTFVFGSMIMELIEQELNQ